MTMKQKELLGYLDAAGLLASSSRPLTDLHVRIIGLDGVGARVASLLASAGVAALELQDRNSVDAKVESAYARGSTGLVRQTALRHQIRKQYPAVRIGAITNPDLVIVSGRRAWDHGMLGRLLSQDRTHLPLTQDNQSVVVGPLIAPGVTPCAVCVDLHMQDSNPFWAQSTFAMAAAPAASAPEYLAVAGAGLAVSMISAVAAGRPLVGDVEPLGRIGGPTQSWTLTQGGVKVQEWVPHPRCSCSIGLVANIHETGEITNIGEPGFATNIHERGPATNTGKPEFGLPNDVSANLGASSDLSENNQAHSENLGPGSESDNTNPADPSSSGDEQARADHEHHSQVVDNSAQPIQDEGHNTIDRNRCTEAAS